MATRQSDDQIIQPDNKLELGTSHKLKLGPRWNWDQRWEIKNWPWMRGDTARCEHQWRHDHFHWLPHCLSVSAHCPVLSCLYIVTRHTHRGSSNESFIPFTCSCSCERFSSPWLSLSISCASSRTLFFFLQHLKFVDNLCIPPNESMDSTHEFSLSTEARYDFCSTSGNFFLPSSRWTQSQTVRAERSVIPYSTVILPWMWCLNAAWTIYCNIEGDRELTDTWTGFTRFTPDGCTWSGWETDKKANDIQTRLSVGRNLERHVGSVETKREKQKWAIEKAKLENARELRGTYFTDPDQDIRKATFPRDHTERGEELRGDLRGESEGSQLLYKITDDSEARNDFLSKGITVIVTSNLECISVLTWSGWNVDGDRSLSEPWTGFTQFTILNEKPPDGYMCSGAADKNSNNIKA